MQPRRPCSALHRLLLSLIFGFLVSAATPVMRAERVEDLPKPTNYVSDFAHVLSPETEARLNRLCGQLDHSATDTQIAVVIVKNLDGDDKADFANRLEEKWKVGKKGSDRGILMLVSVEDRHYWIEVGLGLQGVLPDARVGDIGRLMVPDLKQKNYDSALTTGVVQIANVVAADAKVTLQDEDRAPPPDREPRRHSGSPIGTIFKIILVILVLIFFGARGLFGFGLGMLFGGGGRGGWGGGGGGWGGGGGGSSGGGGFGGFGGGSSDGGGAGGDY